MPVAEGMGIVCSQIGSWYYMPFVLQRDWFGCVGFWLGSLGVGGLVLNGLGRFAEAGSQTTHCS